MFFRKGKDTKDKKSDVGQTGGQRQSSEQIREQALANARAARERLGEDTIQKIAEILQKKQNSPLERAKSQIKSNDPDRVAAQILGMLEDRD